MCFRPRFALAREMLVSLHGKFHERRCDVVGEDGGWERTSYASKWFARTACTRKAVLLYCPPDNSATLRSSHGGQSETAKFICKGYDTVDASDGRISFRGFLQGFCGPHSETGGDCALSFSTRTETKEIWRINK